MSETTDGAIGRVKDLFDLPESIHSIRFVEKLSEAIGTPKETAEKYVLTPPLLEAFDRALALVGTSLKNQQSQATYLHGSFGSGKSHFMALLSLMLKANEDVWRVPEFHPLREKHAFVGTAKLLKLHFHMVGSPNLESAVFGRYLETVRKAHPGATIPGLFADEQFFEDAQAYLDNVGDEDFFKPMNAGAPSAEGWGDLAEGARWDRARFEQSASSLDPEVREELFDALVKTHFRSFAEESSRFKDLDSGLAIVGRHAKGLGYDGVVLFLDELVLWLASRASDVSWFHNEVQKLVKLVEAQDAHRDVPFVSFIARQRDLAEMVGEDYAGIENALVRDSLQWSEGRFETILLEDRNLPTIVEKRVLKPASDASRAALESAFASMKAQAGPAWQTMLGTLDEKEFKRLYPFSPALVEALVALSNSLQRERTAIKLLTELLVEHIETLQLGEVVAVGDLYDVLAGGDDTADGVMKARFESAKQIYQYQFLPLIQKTHGTTSPEACQRLRDSHPARLGCSNCPKLACRNDNRLVKTLIIAALVPEVGPVKNLTASRLVQLNHGSLKVPIAGTEGAMATAKLRELASQIGQLHVGDQADPTLRLQLEGVDLSPILEQANQFDTPGARQRVIREVLFESMGIPPIADSGKDHVEIWRGTRRIGRVVFGNVRRMGPEQLACPEDHDWRLIVDFPFDESGFGPRDDEKVVESFKGSGDGSWTLVWLPSFFSQSMANMLGELVKLEHILESSQSMRQYISHLSVENQSRAANDLENLRTQKKSRIKQALQHAYGLSPAKESDIDPAQSVERHLHVLKPGVQIESSLAANLANALSSFIPRLLEARYPRHPRLTKPLTAKRVEELVRRFGELVDANDKRLAADKALLEEMHGTLGELGLVRISESALFLVEDQMLQRIENKRHQEAVEEPTVADVRRWIDEDDTMGLETRASDLVIRCYARHRARTFVDGGRPYEIKGNLPDHVVLERPDLPSQVDWSRALEAAGTLFGVTLAGRALHADHLKRFESEISRRVASGASHVAELPGRLRERLDALEIDGKVDRLVTARSTDALWSRLRGKSGKEQTEVLASFEPQTSAKAVGRSGANASEVMEILENKLVFGQFQTLMSMAKAPEAAELLEQAAAALRQDEVNVRLAPRLRELAERAQRILTPAPPPRASEVLYSKSIHAVGRSEIEKTLEQAAEDVKEALEGDASDTELSATLELRKKDG